MKYENIGSEYIRARMAQVAFEDRAEVDGLLLLLRWRDRAPSNNVSRMGFAALKARYPQGWLALCREKSPELAAQEEEALAAQQEAARALRLARQAEEATDREAWRRGGGK